jgi:hypothetical protein
MKKHKKYLITIGVEVLSVLTIILLKDIFHAADIKTVFHILCDAFVAVGVTVAGAGLLVFTTNEGTFDGLVFGVQAFINMFKKNVDKKYKNFFEYKESRADKKFEFGYIVICGLVFLVIGIVMYFIYNNLL